MSFSVKTIQDTRRKKQDNTFPVCLQVVLFRKTRIISLGISATKEDFDPKTQQLKKSWKGSSSVSRVNHSLQKKKMRIEEYLFAAQERQELASITLQELKLLLKEGNIKRSDISFEDFTKGIITRLETEQKFGNARIYKDTLRIVLRFQKAHRKGAILSLKGITYDWLMDFKTAYMSRGNSLNGLAVYLRTIRSIFNKGIKQGNAGVTEKDYPFTKFPIKKEETRKRALSLEAIKAIQEYVPVTFKQEIAKDMFLASFFLMGCNYRDLAFLQYGENVKKNTIEYKRKKTGKLHTLPHHDLLRTTFAKYYHHPRRFDAFVFPVITKSQREKQDSQAKDGLKRMNKALKEIGASLGFDSPLTSYSARHSFATISRNSGTSLSIISQAMGHKNTETTSIYLQEIQQEDVHAAQELFLGRFV